MRSSRAETVIGDRLAAVLISLLLLCSSFCLAGQPNVVVILADDLGWGDVGYNGSLIQTPAIDSLATNGITLNRYYAQPSCSPTRSSLMTGQSSLRLGVTQPIDKNLQQGLPVDVRILPEYFQEAGYQTWLVGKWHLGHAYRAQLPMARGFDKVYGNLLGGIGYWDHAHGGGIDWHRNGVVQREEGYVTHLLAREALDLIDRRKAERPFFLYLSFTAPHLPNEAPQDTVAKYSSIADENRRVHAAMVDEMDRAIGQLVSKLEEHDLRENTVIWFMSDNGGLIKGIDNALINAVLSISARLFDPPYPTKTLEFLRSNVMDGGSDNGPYRRGKGSIYEGGVRVPSVIAWPGTLAPRQLTGRVTVSDVMPTLLQLAAIGKAADVKFDGVSQWPLFTNDGLVEVPDYVVHGIEGEAYYSGDWKLIAESEDELSLFNLADDPTETSDMAAVFPDRVRDMYIRLSEYPRGPSIHHTSILDILLDPDTFGGEIDRDPWVEQVREGTPPSQEMINTQ